MSTLMLWLLIIPAMAVVLTFDLSMAWRQYRRRGRHVVGWFPFLLWWAKQSKVKIALVGGVVILVIIAILSRGVTLHLPEVVTLSTKAQWLLGEVLCVAAYVLFDLFMTWRSHRMNSLGHRSTGIRFYRLWLRQSALKFSVVAGVACLALGGVWSANHYNLLQFKSESSGYMANAQRYMDEKKFREAILELRNAIRQNGGDYEAFILLARAQWQLKSLSEARDAYREALRIEPKLYLAHLELGRLALGLNDPTLALAEAKEAGRLAPDAVEPHLLLAQIHGVMGKREESLEQCRAVMGGEFAEPGLRLQFIELLRMQSAFAPMLQAAEAGLKKSPHDWALSLARIDALEMMGRGAEAEALLRSFAATSVSSEPFLVLGDLLMRHGEYILALNGYEEALKRSPDNERAMNNIASLNAEHGFDMERSAALAALLYARHPKEPAVADTLGWTLCRQGKLEQALPLLRQGVTGMPGNPTHRYHLGALLLKMGEQAKGRKELTEALKSGGTFEGSARARALLL